MSKVVKEVVGAVVVIGLVYLTGGLAAFGYTAAQVAFTAGSIILGSALQKHALRNQRDAYNAGLQSRTVTRIATDAPLRFIYGRARVGSDVVAMFTSGANDEYRHLVCVHAAHECDAIEEIYINGEALGALDGSGNVTSGIYASGSVTNVITESHSGSSFTLAQTPIWTPTNHSVHVVTGTGSNQVDVPILSVVGSVVTTGLANGTPCVVTYQINAGGIPRVRVQKHIGTATDTADATLMAELTSGTWPSTAVLRGFCYTVIRLDLNQPTFQNGLPSIEARIRGKKLYDPRTGTTAWSHNPVLAVWDYLVSPLCGVSASDLPTAAFITAANVCDDTSVVAAGRYTFNGTVTSDQDQARTLDAMAHSMAGTIVATTWAIQAGSYVAPIMALVQADIIGDLSITPGISGASIYNGVKGQFIDVNNNYAVTDFIPFQNSTYRTADGIDYFANVDYPFTDTIQAVNNLASIYLADQRNSFTIVADFSLKAWPLQIGDRVTLTSSFIGQTTAIYRVTDKKYSPTSAITLTLKQDDPSIWAYSSTTVQPLAPASNLANPWTILPLASITCTSGDSALLVQPDGSLTPRILVSWPLAPTQAVKTNGQIEIQWQAVGSTAWQSMQVNGSDTQMYTSGVVAGAIYVVRARCINPYMATKSDWVITTYQVVVHSSAPIVYQWATSQPSPPSGMASYTWSSGLFGAAPSGWSLTKPAAPTTGDYTQWSANVPVADISIAGSTPFNWATASLAAVGSNAGAAAIAAQAAADAANTALTAIFADNVLSRDEKTDLTQRFGAINSELSSIRSQADSLSVSRTAYDFAYDALVTYLNSIAASGQPAWDNTSQNSAIVRADANAAWNNYYTAKVSLLNAIATKIQANAAAAQGTANSAASAASAAATAASNAQTDATAANTALGNIFADNVLSRDEKTDLIQRWDAIVAEASPMRTQADSLSVSRTSYDSYADALATYLVSLSPAWNDTSQNTTIVRATANSKWNDYYTAKVSLLNAIATKAATLSTWSGTTGTGKPADNATVGAPSGTNVGGTSASTVESGAAAGQVAKTAQDNRPVVSINSASVATTGANSATSVNIGTATGSVTAGNGALKYAWSLTFGETNPIGLASTITVNSPSALSTSFSVKLPSDTSVIFTATLTVTDASGYVGTASFTNNIQFGIAR